MNDNNWKQLSIFLILFIVFLIIPISQNQQQKAQVIETPSPINIQLTPTQATIYGNNLTLTTARGTSMMPTGSNSQLEIVETGFNNADIKVGRIIIYKTMYPQDYPPTLNNENIQHRVIWRNATHFQTKGDNNTIPDRPQPIDTIRGVVIALIK